MSGWYKQTRGWSARPWFKNANMVQLYAYLKDMAYVADGMYRGHLVRRGSCPSTRSDMMYATGLTYKQVDSSLRRLVEFKEIIVKGYTNCTIITICDYDTCDQQQSLFDVNVYSEGTTKVQQRYNKGTTTPYYKKEDIEDNNNLISHNIPYKKERESIEGLVREIKKQYNTFFSGILPAWQRLSKDMIIQVEACITHYGRQSVDMVFDQVKHEKFHLGENTTGFIADFRFIFRLVNFEGYLSRYELRMKKGAAKPQQEQQNSVGDIYAHVPQEQEPDQRELYLRMIPYADNDRSHSYMALVQAYDRGDLQRLGIDWKPNNIQTR